MPPLIATAILAAGVIGLFVLDRDETSRATKALWIPLIWLVIVGSRPVSAWLRLGQPMDSTDFYMGEGSPLDRDVFMALLAAGTVVLIARMRAVGTILRTNVPVVLFFAYCLLSVLWSDFPDIAIKRWTKAIGDLVMALVVVTDPDPVAALKRFFSRAGFLLLPASILFIRYFGQLGRGYDPDGLPMNTGVTSNKNTLGVITFVVSLGALWQIVTLLDAGSQPNRGRRLLAQGTLLVFGVALLAMAHSATSAACFAMGAVLILVTNFPIIKRRPGAVHGLVVAIVLAAGFSMLSGDVASVTQAVGRQTNLTGRTDIWAAVLRVAPDPVVGTGFESFWLGPRVESVWRQLSQFMHVNEAHNGYIEVYLNLGWVGVCLIVLILVSGYRRAVAAFRCDPAIGSLMLAYVVAAAMYSITEAGFRLLNPIWIFLLLATTLVPEVPVPENPPSLGIAHNDDIEWALQGEGASSARPPWGL
jgi:exopolysaccharide production protein ExoQ